MRFAVSNIGLPAYDHTSLLGAVRNLGLEGVEVAPSRVWRDTWHGLSGSDVRAYRKAIEDAGLNVIGLHSLFYDQPSLALFEGLEKRARAIDFLVHLSAVCRDLGGRTLVLGGGRKRGDTPLETAFHETIDFLGDYCNRVESHGTVLCMEPLGINDSDFVNSIHDSVRIVDAVGHPALGLQLDAKALVENGEATFESFDVVRGRLDHFHANEPGLNVLGSSHNMPHVVFGDYLRKIGYTGYVSIEQRMLSETAPLADTRASAQVLKESYR